MVAHTVPFVAAAALLTALEPITAPVALILIAHAWIIPELYAARGAGVVRERPAPAGTAETRALGLLGDLVGHEPRELHARTGLMLERGSLGVWLVGESGALLVRGGGRRVYCYCVKPSDPSLPTGDRVAHLLLALRPMNRASRPSPTSRYVVRAGACAGASRKSDGRRSIMPCAPRGRYEERNFIPRANAPCRATTEHSLIMHSAPLTPTSAPSKLFLVSDRRSVVAQSESAVRRFRLARLRVQARPVRAGRGLQP